MREGAHAKTYYAWNDMRKRCLNKSRNEYHQYGGRGIKICERWNSYDNFIADMGEAPDGLTLDRIDNDGDYSKENCRWATYTEQNRNKSNNMLTLDDAKEIVRLHKGGMFQRVIADRYGITQMMVSDICTGKTWIEATQMENNIASDTTG